MNNHTTNVVLDEKFTNSVRSSVQGSLASDLKSDMSPVIS